MRARTHVRMQLLACVLCKGPMGTAFDFRHAARGTNAMMDELGRSLANICRVCPDGIVAFFPSYAYEQQCHDRWKQSGLLDRLAGTKHLFREPSGSDGPPVDTVLREFQEAIEKPRALDKSPPCPKPAPPGSSQGNKQTGAMLNCVVGGKLSEGINFSDHLGRCIVMIGLPYPNPHDPELKERMDFERFKVARMASSSHGAASRGLEDAGKEFYENICMRAVNQSIGRAIRHMNDYASIVLLDGRYARQSTKARLPGWITDKQFVTAESYGVLQQALCKFFKGKGSFSSA